MGEKDNSFGSMKTVIIDSEVDDPGLLTHMHRLIGLVTFRSQALIRPFKCRQA